MFLPRNAFADNLYGPVAEASGLSTNRVLDQDNTWREDLINLNRNNTREERAGFPLPKAKAYRIARNRLRTIAAMTAEPVYRSPFHRS